MAPEEHSGSDAARSPAGDTLAGHCPPLPTEIFSRAGKHDTEPAARAASDGTGGASNDGQPPYEILGELGRGGVGIVYKVRQRQLGRVAALKVLAAGPSPDSDTLARFHIEARAVAALQHPNIVQLHEIGQWNGRAYLLLEFLPNGCLAEKVRGSPQDPREAARIVEIVARAMQFAHDRGIVHRDLKPANILLAEDGTPKVTDFGLAKHLETPSQTRTGDIMGTPSYMAPEQAGGVTKLIGPACDVYSLGAILYELVTGRPPFRGQNPVETVMQVLSQDPLPPRLFASKIPPDLETIILKCLEKSPRGRYESAAALADDLARFLADEPIRARPIRAWQRVAKWARRHPATAALIGVVILATVTIISYGFWKNRELSQALTETEQARQRAERNFAKALKTTADRLNSAGQDFQSLVQDELDFFKDIYEQTGDDADARYEKALARKGAGDVFVKLRDFAAAKESLEISVALLKQLHQDSPESLEFGRQLAAARVSLGNLQQATGDVAAAAATFRQALELFDELSERAPDDKLLQSAKGILWNNFAMTEIRRKRFPEAEDSFGRALEIHLALAEEPNKPTRWTDGHWHDLAATYVNFSSLYLQTDRPQQAVDALLKSLAIYEQLPQFSTEKQFREDQASTVKRLAAAYLKLRQFDRSRDTYVDAQKRLKKLAKDFPDLPGYSQLAAETEADLGMLAAMAREPAATAIGHYRTAIHEYERLAARFPNSPAYPLAIISNLYNIRLLHLDVQQSEPADQDWHQIVKVVEQAAAVGTFAAADLEKDTGLMLLRTDSKFPELLTAAAKAAQGPQPPEHD